MSKPEFLTTSQVANLLGIGNTHIGRIAKQNGWVNYGGPRCSLYSADVVKAFKAEHPELGRRISASASRLKKAAIEQAVKEAKAQAKVFQSTLPQRVTVPTSQMAQVPQAVRAEFDVLQAEFNCVKSKLDHLTELTNSILKLWET